MHEYEDETGTERLRTLHMRNISVESALHLLFLASKFRVDNVEICTIVTF